MTSDNGQKLVLFENLLDRVETKFIGALSLNVLNILGTLGFSVGDWVGPEKVTQESLEWGLDESFDFIDILHCLEVRRDTSMHA